MRDLLFTVEEEKEVEIFSNEESAFEEIPFIVAEEKLFEKQEEVSIVEEERKIGLLQIEGEIKPASYVYVKKALEEFSKQKVDQVILHLNTPGGEVFSAVRIVEALKKVAVPLSCYIDNWAISAGALIAYACPEIYVSKTAIMGAAEPLQASAEGMSSASEKINSALRAQFAVTAELHGRNPLLAKAMVDKDLLLVEREGEIVVVAENETIQSMDRIICHKGKLLTLTCEEMVRFGIAKKVLPSIADLTFPSVEVLSYKDIRGDFLSFLAHPLVSTLLTVGFLLGLFLEISQPGTVLPGILALLCLGLNLLAQYSLELFNFFEVIFLALGISLLLFEFLVYSTNGVLAFLGILFFLMGGVLLVVPQLSQWEVPRPLIWHSFFEKGVWATAVLLCILAGFLFFSKRILYFLFETSPFVLRNPDFDKSKEPSPLRIGALAQATTPLRPSGKIVISGILYDALSQGEYIPSGMKLRVVGLEGTTVFVKKL